MVLYWYKNFNSYVAMIAMFSRLNIYQRLIIQCLYLGLKALRRDLHLEESPASSQSSFSDY